MIAMTQTATWIAWLAVLVFGTALSAMYAAGETSIYVMNKIRLDLRAEAGSSGARLLRRMLSNANNLLAVLLIGNNIGNYAATFAISTMFVMAGCGEMSHWYTLAVATPLLFILGESVPKNVSQRLGDSLAYRLARPLWLSNILYNAVGVAPIVRGLASAITGLARRRGTIQSPLGHDGFAAIVAEGQASGALTHFQSIMTDRIMHIADITLHDVMVPLERTVCVSKDAGREQLLAVVTQHNYSRFPVRDSTGAIVGVMDVYDLLANPDRLTQDKPAPPMKLPFFMTVPDALYHMQRDGARLAVVTDDAARPIGIVTIKDLVEEIVGELEAW